MNAFFSLSLAFHCLFSCIKCLSIDQQLQPCQWLRRGQQPIVPSACVTFTLGEVLQPFLNLPLVLCVFLTIVLIPFQTQERRRLLFAVTQMSCFFSFHLYDETLNVNAHF